MAAGGRLVRAPGPGQRLLLDGSPGHRVVPATQSGKGRPNRIRPLSPGSSGSLLSSTVPPPRLQAAIEPDTPRSRSADLRTAPRNRRFLIPRGGVTTPPVCHWLDESLMGGSRVPLTKPRPRPYRSLALWTSTGVPGCPCFGGGEVVEISLVLGQTFEVLATRGCGCSLNLSENEVGGQVPGATGSWGSLNLIFQTKAQTWKISWKHAIMPTGFKPRPIALQRSRVVRRGQQSVPTIPREPVAPLALILLRLLKHVPSCYYSNLWACLLKDLFIFLPSALGPQPGPELPFCKSGVSERMMA